MSANKKQHYVPKFYLKLFSNKGEGTHLGLYQPKKMRYIPNAGLSDQAYGIFFYGQDGEIEKLLSAIEGDARKIIHDIINKESMPVFGTNQYKRIIAFCMLQSFRTEAMLNQINQSLNSTFRLIASYSGDLKNKLENVEIRVNEGPAFLVKSIFEKVEHTFDLQAKLLINDTSIPFITSDHPIAMCNQFLTSRRHPGGVSGLFAKGLQVFYPLTNKYMILFYDSKIYKVGDKKSGQIHLTKMSDIDNINAMQLVNCDELLYFSDRVTEKYIKNLHDRFKKYIKYEKNKTGVVSETEKPDGTFSILLHTQYEGINFKLDFSFIKETKYAKKYEMTGYIIELRNEKLRHTLRTSAR